MFAVAVMLCVKHFTLILHPGNLAPVNVLSHFLCLLSQDKKVRQNRCFLIFSPLGLTPKVINVLPLRGFSFANAVAEAPLVKLLILLCLASLIVVKGLSHFL